MEHRLEERIDAQPRKSRDWRLAVVGGGLLALAGMLVTIGAVYQLQLTGAARRAAALERPEPSIDPQLEARRAAARRELEEIRAQRDRAAAQEWRDRVDRDSGADEIRCYGGVRMVRHGSEWMNAGSC